MNLRADRGLVIVAVAVMAIGTTTHCIDADEGALICVGLVLWSFNPLGRDGPYLANRCGSV